MSEQQPWKLSSKVEQEPPSSQRAPDHQPAPAARLDGCHADHVRFIIGELAAAVDRALLVLVDHHPVLLRSTSLYDCIRTPPSTWVASALRGQMQALLLSLQRYDQALDASDDGNHHRRLDDS